MSVEDFDRDWKIDWPSSRISCDSPTEETVYTVTDFWKWVRKEESSTVGRAFPRVITSDGIGASYNLPRKVKLLGNSTIDSQSLQLLVGTDSTLLDQKNNVLVPDSQNRSYWQKNSFTYNNDVELASLTSDSLPSEDSMSFDTPRKKKRRDKLVKKFSENWELNLSSVPTLKYKRKKGIRGVWQNVFGRKHSVFAMYWFFKHERQNNEVLRKFHFPLKHDNMPVEDVPFKYQLQGKWYLDDDDLKFLYGGPLIDQNRELLVKADTRFNRFIRFCQIATPPVSFLVAITTLLIRLPSVLDLLRHVFD